MKIEGSCHCGRISYAAEIDPERVMICHCSDCQNSSGAPYRANVPAALETFMLRGEAKIYLKKAASGNEIAIAFCGDCGTALYSKKAENAAVLNLRLGAVKQRAQLTPKAQFWCRSAMPWAMDIRDIPQSMGQTRPHGPGSQKG